MARICPCSSELTKRDFIFYFIIIDLFIGVSSIIGAIFAIIALIYYVRDQNFSSGYFKFYAIFSLIISAIYTIAVFFVGASHYSRFGKPLTDDHSPDSFLAGLALGLILLPLNLWMIYLSINLITVTFDDLEEKAAANDIEQTLDNDQNNAVDIEANKEQPKQAVDNEVNEDSIKSEIEV